MLTFFFSLVFPEPPAASASKTAMCYTDKKALIANDVPTRHHHQSPPLSSVNIHHKDCSCLHIIAALFARRRVLHSL